MKTHIYFLHFYGGYLPIFVLALNWAFFGMTKPWATSPDGYRVPAAFSLHSIDLFRLMC